MFNIRTFLSGHIKFSMFTLSLPLFQLCHHLFPIRYSFSLTSQCSKALAIISAMANFESTIINNSEEFCSVNSEKKILALSVMSYCRKIDRSIYIYIYCLIKKMVSVSFHLVHVKCPIHTYIYICKKALPKFFYS